MKKLLIVLLTFLCICNLNAQNENPRSKFPLGINAGINIIPLPEYLLLEGSIDYLFTPHISAEINIGWLPADLVYFYSFGGKYWFARKTSKSGFSPFTGLMFTGVSGTILESSGKTPDVYFLKIPAGVSYIAPFGLQTSLQLNGLFNYDGDLFVFPTLEFKVGWRFKVK